MRGNNLGFTAGKNKIINGDFRLNQRAFTSITTTAQYGFDRWALGNAGNFGTVTYTPQNFTLGTAPVAGYEGTTFARITTTGQTQTGVRTALRQPIESVRTLANSTVTVSFWAKAASGTPKIAINLEQQFGTGGSPSANVDNYLGQATLSTSWARYSVTGSIASISGKTIGTNNNDLLMLHLVVSAGSDFDSSTGSLGIQSNTFDIWGVQVEAGSVATPFQTATGTLQGELAACQRYYAKTYATATAPGTATLLGSFTYKTGYTDSFHSMGSWRTPVPMRDTPTITLYSTNDGATGQIYDGTTNRAGTAAGYIGATGVTPYINNISLGSGLVLSTQIVASAEL